MRTSKPLIEHWRTTHLNPEQKALPVGYAEKDSVYFGYSREEMLPFVPEQATEILEVGCGSGAFAATLKRSRPVRITAIEPFPTAAEIAAKQVDSLIRGSIEDGLHELQGQRFDCVVMNDVLEHLVDPWATLEALGPLLGADGVVVASIPNIRYMPVLREYFVEGEWRYQDFGVMDRTHLRFFTRKSILRMFAECGYEVVQIEGINASRLAWKFGLLNRLLRGRFDDARFMQFAVVARFV